MLTFLLSALLFDIVYYADGIISEFKVTERVETLPIAEITTFNPNNTDGLYLTFRYTDPKTGEVYSNPHIFTSDKTYKGGDEVKVVTRNDRPSALLCQTKRGRQRTLIERAADVGYERGMVIHIIIISILIIIVWLPNHKKIPNEIRARKTFFTVVSEFYALITVAACTLWIIAVHDKTWDSLAYGALSVLIYAGGSIVLLTAWIINSIIRKKAAQQLRSEHNS